MKQRHLTPDEIRAIVKHQTSYHKEEAVRQASDEVVSQVYASLALAIMQTDDGRTDEEKGEYIQAIFNRSAEIWYEAANTGKARSYRQIVDKLKTDYGIEVNLR